VIAQSGSSGLATIIPLILMVAIFYFLLIRPQQRRMRQQRQLVESLEVGDDILTIGGLFGRVTGMDDEALDVELAPGTTVRLLKSAVARRLTEPAPEEDLEDEEEEEASESP